MKLVHHGRLEQFSFENKNSDIFILLNVEYPRENVLLPSQFDNEESSWKSDKYLLVLDGVALIAKDKALN